MLDLHALRIARCRLRDAQHLGSGIVAEKSAICRGVGHGGEDPLHFLDEAHLQHLVRFVEHDHADLDEVEAAAVEVIDEPPGRADDDVRAALEALELRNDRRAAVHRQDADRPESSRHTSASPRRPAWPARASA